MEMNRTELSDRFKTQSLNLIKLCIEVCASSVNPLDLMKKRGHGAIIFEKQRQNKFPWVLGSDFSGVVKGIGSQVTKFKVGDEVWGCTSHANSGTHVDL